MERHCSSSEVLYLSSSFAVVLNQIALKVKFLYPCTFVFASNWFSCQFKSINQKFYQFLRNSVNRILMCSWVEWWMLYWSYSSNISLQSLAEQLYFKFLYDSSYRKSVYAKKPTGELTKTPWEKATHKMFNLSDCFLLSYISFYFVVRKIK